ncbi:MAG: M15 family metallopeptidase [Candidatus Omnitrophota bacterium]
MKKNARKKQSRRKKTSLFLMTVALIAGLVFLIAQPPVYSLDFERLSDEGIAMRKQVIEKLEPLIRKRDGEKNLSRLTFDELYEPLLKEEREFMEKFRNIPAKEVGVRIPWRGIATGKEELVMIRGQKVKEKVRVKTSDGKRKTVIRTRTIPPQFLPPNVYKQYEKMMLAMEKSIGKRLYVDSGYRSSAYQLYLFVYFLKNHDFSVRETVKFVALPGYSEHGSPKYQAIDFINEDGIDGDPNVKEFEALPENTWLHAHAREYGFVLSYPKDAGKGITYEPWHWRYDPKAAKKLAKKRSQSAAASRRASSGAYSELAPS